MAVSPIVKSRGTSNMAFVVHPVDKEPGVAEEMRLSIEAVSR